MADGTEVGAACTPRGFPAQSHLEMNPDKTPTAGLDALVSSAQGLKIGPASIDDEYGNLTVEIDGRLFNAGEKYTILEWGWALYFTTEPLPDEWLRRYGETRPSEEGWNELPSHDDTLVTTHPVLVALSLRAWWHRNGRPIPTAPTVPVPTFVEAVEEVRVREMLNDFNAHHAGQVPGLKRWMDPRLGAR